jgi:signal transduction histidine kinase
MRRFVSPAGVKAPGAVLAVSLHHENQYYGVLWIGYPESRLISEEEVRFISTLASQAGMTAANAKLYATAELGRQRLEAVINSTPEPVMVFDDNDRLILMNPAAMQLRGLINSTNPGQNLKDVVSNEILYDLIKCYSSNMDVTRELQLSNDCTYYISVSSVMNNQKIVGKVCLLRDITHFRIMDTLKTDVVATVSHDLRSPLTYMKGYVSLLTAVGPLNDQQRSYVEKIGAGVENMTKLVNNLLDLSRIEAGVKLSIEKVSPNLIIDQIISGLRPVATHNHINLSIGDAEYNDLLVDADPELLHQAVFNLVDNAIKFNNLGGTVEVILTTVEGKAIFEIRDNGIGISPIDLPHLFEKFYRSNRRESYKNRGTGLGLAIVKSIAERHFGRVWVESKLGRGSSFFFEIPTNHPKSA